MIRLDSAHLEKERVSRIEQHRHICDLIYVEGPILSLYRDAKYDWLYLWCDTDTTSTERWLLFPVTRNQLVDYLDGTVALRDLLKRAKQLFALDHSLRTSGGTRSTRFLRRVVNLAAVQNYLPTHDSFFPALLSPDISIQEQLLPDSYAVPIDGNWFFSDLDRFSRVYSQLYSFFYCTGDRFVTNIEERLRANLRAPWRGGGSRVSLFQSLKEFIPAIHDLKINKFQYASPGEIQIEALKSVGNGIAETVQSYLQNEIVVAKAQKILNSVLDNANLRTKNLSTYTNSNLPLTPTILTEVDQATAEIIDALKLQSQYSTLQQSSPNIIVTSKVLLALVKRLAYIAEQQKLGLIDGSRW